ncbi:MAG: hypothetical protein K2Q18_05215, partial [Bdellovibrionales bacterium]|nr:hypothetical protein [Bdellovibrionales bacterium]
PNLPEMKKFEDNGDTIDYGTNFKGNNIHHEVAIDTIWRSDWKKDNTIVESTEEDEKSTDAEIDNIDMYYRGKQQKNIDLFAGEDPFKREKKVRLEDEEEIEKKKRITLEDMEVESLRQKRLNNEEDQKEAERKEKIQTELELTLAKKNKMIVLEDEVEGKGPTTDEHSADDTLSELKKKGIDLDLMVEGSLSGKVKIDDEVDKNDDEVESELEYGPDRKKDKKNTELDLEAADQDDLKKKEEEEESKNVSEAKLDIKSESANKNGKDGKVDHIETMMSSKTDSKKNIEPIDELAELELAMQIALEKQAKELKQESLLELEDGASDLEEQTNLLRDDDEKTKKRTSMDLEGADGLERKARTKEEQSDSADKKRDTSPLLEKVQDLKDREKTIKDDDSDLDLRSFDKFDPLEKTERDHTHNGNVEKIDTFYRSGESKKSDQNWDDLNKRNASVNILLTKSTRAPDDILKKEDKEYSEVTIDYRKLKEEFDMINNGSIYSDEDGVAGKKGSTGKEYDEDSFKVQEIDPKSLDFAVHVINAVYEKDMKPKKIFSLLVIELLSNYQCFPVFYNYKLGEKKFIETYNVFTEPTNDLRVTAEVKDWWHEFKKDTALFEHFQSKSMSTWRCAEIVKDGLPWEDVELPTWADKELTNKRVELIFPYFDGIDRMGMCVVFFPKGLDPKKAMGLLTLLEMARTLFLDTIERYQVKEISPEREIEKVEEVVPEKKKVLSFFSGIFGKKKAG